MMVYKGIGVTESVSMMVYKGLGLVGFGFQRVLQ